MSEGCGCGWGGGVAVAGVVVWLWAAGVVVQRVQQVQQVVVVVDRRGWGYWVLHECVCWVVVLRQQVCVRVAT